MEFSCMPGVVELEAGEGIKSPARFKKELLRAGTYTHPQDPQLQLTITPERMEKWVEGFKTAPFKVYVPLRHTKDPTHNAGWLENLFLEEQRLYGILCITDEDIAQKIRDGSIQDVSLAVEKDVTDADGNTYEELITHVALTLDPHFRQQEPFLELEGGSPPINQNLTPSENTVEGEIRRYLLEGKITPASVACLRPLLMAQTPIIFFESGEPQKFCDGLRAFLATLPSAVNYQELGQVEIWGPPGRLSPERAEKEARRILHR